MIYEERAGFDPLRNPHLSSSVNPEKYVDSVEKRARLSWTGESEFEVPSIEG